MISIIERNNKIIALRAEGASYQKIADEFSISRQRVHQIVCQIKNKPVLLIPAAPKLCVLCGKFFQLQRGNVKLCPSCRKGGLSTLLGRERTREMVRARDLYTCQRCLKKWNNGQRRFDVHHLNGQCGKKSRSYDKISSLGEMVTLCHKCHFSHHQFSRKNQSSTGGGKKIFDRDEAKSLQEKGMTLQEIADQLGVSKTAIYKVLRKS